jgi:hypothetical protein
MNQQSYHQQETQARLTFQQSVNDEITNIYFEITNIQNTVNQMVGW